MFYFIENKLLSSEILLQACMVEYVDMQQRVHIENKYINTSVKTHMWKAPQVSCIIQQKIDLCRGRG